MTSIEAIRREIDQEIFNYTQLMMALSDYRKPRDVVTSLLRKNQVVRIRKGLYIFGPLYRRNAVAAETLANLIYGPSVISLDYALSWYGLIPEHVVTITSITTGRSRIFNTPEGRFSYMHCNVRHYAADVTMGGTPPMTWLMTGPLKSLADKVWADKRFQPSSADDFSGYLQSDLRLDQASLEKYYNREQWQQIEKKYDARKITLLGKYFHKSYGG